MFSSLGFQQHAEAAHHPQRQTEAGLFVVARTKQVDEVGNVTLQSQDPSQVSPESLSERGELRKSGLQLWCKNQHTSTKENNTTATQDQILTLPQLLEEAEICVHPPLDQSVKEAEPMIQPQPFYETDAQTPGLGPNDQLPAALTQSPVGPTCPKGPAPDVKESSSASQAQNSTSSIRRQPNTPQSGKTSPQALVLVRGEVHSKARSMARSRMEKARFRLQGRIQQAIKLFGGKEMTESQAKRKQVPVSNPNVQVYTFSLSLSDLVLCSCLEHCTCFHAETPRPEQLKLEFHIEDTFLCRPVVFCYAQLPVWSVYVCAALCLSVQRALKILQPAILEEFLDAVEGFGTFCTGPQVQDLKLLSDSVRNQWEVWQGLH